MTINGLDPRPMSRRGRPSDAVLLLLGAVLAIGAVGLSFGVARVSGWWTPYAAGSIHRWGAAAESSANAPACDLDVNPLPVEQLELTIGCQASGIDVVFPSGHVVEVIQGTSGFQGEGYDLTVVGLVNEGLVAIEQTGHSVTYWGSTEGIRAVQYGFGAPEAMRTP